MSLSSFANHLLNVIDDDGIPILTLDDRVSVRPRFVLDLGEAIFEQKSQPIEFLFLVGSKSSDDPFRHWRLKRTVAKASRLFSSSDRPFSAELRSTVVFRAAMERMTVGITSESERPEFQHVDRTTMIEMRPVLTSQNAS